METRLPKTVPQDLREWRSWRTAANDRLLEMGAIMEDLAAEVRALRQELAKERGAPVPLLDTNGVAAYLNVSKRKVSELIASGELLPIKIGRRNRFTFEMVDTYLRRTTRNQYGNRGRKRSIRYARRPDKK